MKNLNPLNKLNQLSSGILQEQAAAYLASGSYKMTQEIYKLLLKREENPVFRKGLADCYLKRALHAAEQGKLKDAVTFWENYQENSGGQQYNHDYLSWLVETGNDKKIKNFLSSLADIELEREFPDVALKLGYYHATGRLDINSMIDKNSALAQHTALVDQAFTALQDNALQPLQSILKQIPFRSVYRDLVTVLKAAMLVQQSPDQAKALVLKIHPESPYADVAALLDGFVLSGKALADFLMPLPAKQQEIIGKANHWTSNQIKLLNFLSRQKKQLNIKAKFELAIQYQGLVGQQFAQRFCLALLPEYPSGKTLYEKNFGKLDAFESARIKALTLEAKGEIYDALDYWEKAAEALKQALKSDTGNHLMIAMIYCHVARFLDSEDRIRYLQESLHYDSKSLLAHQLLLDCYKQGDMKQEAIAQLNTMLETFPDYVSVLEQAMQQALDKKAYKKACTYANKILKLDRVNSRAKQVLFDSHCKHAIKQIKAGKYHLAEKEIASAEQMNLGKDYPSQIAILKGLLAYFSLTCKQGIEAIKSALQAAPNRRLINAYRVFQLAEAVGLCLSEYKTFKVHNLPVAYLLSTEELNDFLSVLDAHYKEQPYAMAENLELLKKDIKRLLKNCAFSDDQLVAVVQRFEKIKHFEMMNFCLSCAQNNKAPIWKFYRIYIKNQGQPYQFSLVDIQKINKILDEARKADDNTCITLITNLFDRIERFNANEDMLAQEDLDVFDPYQLLFDQIDDRSMNKINKRFEQLTENLSEEKIVKKLMQFVGEQAALKIVFENPACLDAMLFLMAAKELGLEHGITVQDILDIAQNQNVMKPPDFSF